MTKALPQNITSYDLLKAFAVIIMVIDHTGFYFFPSEEWWRAVGRIGFPIWFFLIGYAQGRDLPLKLWAGIGILILSDIVFGLSIVPLSALVTIALIRISIGVIMENCSRNKQALWPFSAILFFLVLPSFYVAEYGTQAMIMGVFGWLVRNGRKNDFTKSDIQNYMLFAAFSFIIFQQLQFQFSTPWLFVMGLGTMAVLVVLYRFGAREFPKATAKTPCIVRAPIQLMGRRTLEIYVFHLVLFKALGLWTDPDRFSLFEWQWIYQTG